MEEHGLHEARDGVRPQVRVEGKEHDEREGTPTQHVKEQAPREFVAQHGKQEVEEHGDANDGVHVLAGCGHAEEDG